jgi:hypothetical protein
MNYSKKKETEYITAQFYPRMAVYNDVEGWQNMQFGEAVEFACPFGDLMLTSPFLQITLWKRLERTEVKCLRLK